MNYRVDEAKLKAKMAMCQYNVGTLAEAMHVCRSTVSAVLNGKPPTYSIMCKMAETLHLTPKEAGDIFFSSDLRSA